MKPESGNGCPFKQADRVDKRLKLLMYGDTGTGKTITSLHFPRPAIIDMEKGSELYGEDYSFHVIPATTPEEVRESVDWLLNNKHDFATLVLDPVTIYWSALQDKWSDIFKVRKKTGSGFKFEFYEFQPRDWMTIKAEGKALMRMLSRLDMNVICTAHRKDRLDGNMSVIGSTYDGMKGIDYFFDVVLELSKNPKGKFMARVIKDRTNTLPKGEFAMSYVVFEDALGAKSLGREATPVPYANAAQLEELENWYVVFTMEPPKIKKLLAKYGVDNKDELTEEIAVALIADFEKAYEKRQKAKEAASA